MYPAATVTTLVFLLGLLRGSRQLDLEYCEESLGVEDPAVVPDSAFTASSSYDDVSVGPESARLHLDSSRGGAWCPSRAIRGAGSPPSSSAAAAGAGASEYLEIDLGRLAVIRQVLTQGRYAKGLGQEYAEAFTLQYWRAGMTDFKGYRDSVGREIFPGNSNTFSVSNNSLAPAIVASKIRLSPYSEHPRTVCLRVGLRGCLFNEGVVSYSTPQGMVRGSTLELMDHTFDGQEDSQTGDLRGGLGQLVDGRYGEDNFKATLGFVKGYEWVGWRRRDEGAESVNLVFSFDKVRSFHRVDIHSNNHFTKDVQVFKEAKIYFSNEEDKFGDDRFVGFKYMPDLALENARNVSIDLKGEHGQFVMIQLFFAAKWILISEVTFLSVPYSPKPFPTPNEVPQEPRFHVNDGGQKTRDEDSEAPIKNAGDLVLLHNDVQVKKTNVVDTDGNLTSDLNAGESEGAGVSVGVLLLTMAILVAAAAGFAYYRFSRPSKNTTPTHSLLSRKCTVGGGDDDNSKFEIPSSTCGGSAAGGLSYTAYTASAVNKMSSVYDRAAQETIYEEPKMGNMDIERRSPPGYGVYPTSGGFLSLNGNFSNSDPVLSEDYCTDDYAEPMTTTATRLTNMASSNSFTTPNEENIYAVVAAQRRQQIKRQAAAESTQQRQRRPALRPLPIAHYARPLSPQKSAPVGIGMARNRSSNSRTEVSLGGSGANIRLSPPPQGQGPGRVLVRRASSTAVSMRPSPPAAAAASAGPIQQLHDPQQRRRLPCAFASLTLFSSPTSSVPPPHTTPSETATEGEGGLSTTSRSSSNSTICNKNAAVDDRFFYAATDVCIPDSLDLAKLYMEIGNGGMSTLPSTVSSLPSRPDSRIAGAAAATLDLGSIHLNELPRNNVEFVEKLGEGEFGEVHLCRLIDAISGSKLVAVKSLRIGCNEGARTDFIQEARILTCLNHPNLVSVVGVCVSDGDPLYMICEYGDKGDLCQFLQDHVAETSLSKSSGVPTLSYGSLIHIASQIAAGMKYLESLNFVHRDLATRNCLVGGGKAIKISDFGMSRPCYRSDYFKSQAGCLLPIRWMAWESVLMGKFTTKSDVWSFGVTLWEVLTLAREMPYQSLSDEKVVANLSLFYKERSSKSAAVAAATAARLPNPHGCPREVRDLMCECWQREEKERPSFREIHLFLQRKNLGYDPGDDG